MFTHTLRVTATDVMALYKTGRYSAREISEQLGIGERTVFRRLSEASARHECCAVAARAVVALMDASYWGRNFGVVIIKDNISGRVMWHKFIDRKEKVDDYSEGIEWLIGRGFTIKGIVSDGLKGLRNKFKEYKFQHCQFHQVQYVKTRLTNKPKTPAAVELLALVKMMCHTDKESFVGAFNDWEARWADFLKEKSVSDDGKSYYKHRRLRSAWLSIKHNMEWLWTFYDNPDLGLPNTNNAMEGLNSVIKEKLGRHRGLSTERRKVLITAILKAHNPKRL